MVEVRMAGRDDQFVILVLEFGQLLGDAVGVMVVDEGDGADDRRVGCGGALGNQAIANQIAESLGAVGVAAARDGAVKTLEEIRIESDADAAEVAHRACLSRGRRHRVARWREGATAGITGGGYGEIGTKGRLCGGVLISGAEAPRLCRQPFSGLKTAAPSEWFRPTLRGGCPLWRSVPRAALRLPWAIFLLPLRGKWCGAVSGGDGVEGGSSRGLGAKGVDGGAEAGGEFVGLADGHARGGDGFADGEGDGAGIEVAGVDGQQIVDAAERDGDERDLGADGEESCAGEKVLSSPSGVRPAFREDEEGHAGAEGFDAGAEAESVAWVLAVSMGIWPERLRYQPMKGDGPQLFFGEDAELEGQRGKMTGVSI